MEFDFAVFCQNTADLNHQQGIPITFEMLAGEGQYRDLQTQLNFNPAAYAQTNAAAQKAWRKIPMPGKRAEELTKVVQGPDEPFQDFLSRLLQAAGRILGDSDAGLLLVKQLAFENANSACQAAIRPYRNEGGLSDYVR